MWQGKVSAAWKLLNSDYDNGVLKVDDNVFKDLQEKHPKLAPIKKGSLLQGPIDKQPASYWDAIDKSVIATATRLTKVSRGPSQLDAEQFRRTILNEKFKKESKDLREQMVLLAKNLATTLVDLRSIEAFAACRLIALNKNPGSDFLVFVRYYVESSVEQLPGH